MATSTGGRGGSRRKRDSEVLGAAAKVFFERGYSDATVQDVAHELGILKGSLYHYIDTKEDLLFRLLEQVHAEVEEILEHVMVESGLDPLDRLRLYVRLQVLHNLDDVQRISIYYHDVERLAGERLDSILRRRRAHERFVTGLIRDAQAAGLAAPGLDPRVLANCVFATIIWTHQWYRPGGRLTRTQVADLCVDFGLTGVVGAR